MVDRIRVVSNTGQNLRLHPGTGVVVANDTPLNGADTSATGAAYTNNFPGASGTTLYSIITATDALAVQAPPHNGPSPPSAPWVSTPTPGWASTSSPWAASTSPMPAHPGSGHDFEPLYREPGPRCGHLVGTIGGGELIVGLAIVSGELLCSLPLGTPGVIIVARGGTPTFSTEGPDVICGTAGVDRGAGLGGDDLILGLGGNDQLRWYRHLRRRRRRRRPDRALRGVTIRGPVAPPR